jgi:hypothetical protein
MAVRRVVVTPTFAAGLGVVVAAVLAYQPQTVFSYAAPNGAPCNGSSCGVPAQAGGEPAARAGARLPTPAASPSRPAVTVPAQPARSAARDNDTRPVLAAVPELGFRTTGSGRWGFDATIYITFPPGTAHQPWHLRFGYPSARILKLWAGRFLVHGVHTALVTSADWSGQAAGQRTLTFSIGVTGRPVPPRKCSFDGRTCHISARYGARRWDLWGR